MLTSHPSKVWVEALKCADTSVTRHAGYINFLICGEFVNFRPVFNSWLNIAVCYVLHLKVIHKHLVPLKRMVAGQGSFWLWSISVSALTQINMSSCKRTCIYLLRSRTLVHFSMHLHLYFLFSYWISSTDDDKVLLEESQIFWSPHLSGWVKGHIFSFKDHWAVVRMWIVGPKCRIQVIKKLYKSWVLKAEKFITIKSKMEFII